MSESSKPTTTTPNPSPAQVTGTAAVAAEAEKVVSAGKSKKLKYPLRSSLNVRPKRDKSPDLTTQPRRGRSTAISQSVSVLDISGKPKSVNTPGRLSVNAKSVISSSRTPRSEASVRKSVMGQVKSDTPVSDISKLSSRRRFNLISSASYWLQQINLSESVGKHSISLGFFKLALDAGSEPLQLLRDELKCYVRKHNLTEVGETLKPLLESYDLSESLEKQQISDTGSQVVEDGVQSSDQTAPISNPSSGTKKLRGKVLSFESSKASSAKEPSKQNVQKIAPASKIRASTTRNSGTLKPSAESGSHKVWKKVKKPGEQEAENGKVMVKKQQKQSETGQALVKKLQKEPAAVQVIDLAEMDTTVEDKENMDFAPVEEAAVNK